MASSDSSDSAEEHVEGEGSQTSLSDLHLSQTSSLSDSDLPVDLTNEDKSLISHAFLFPASDGFTKEDLIRLWIAEGLFQENQSPGDRVEDEASVKFDSFVPRILHTNMKEQLYKLQTYAESSFRRTISDCGYVRISDDSLRKLVPDGVKHLCIHYESFDDTKFDSLKRFEHLRTLFILPQPVTFFSEVTSFSQVPCDLFLSLKNLTTLNFSNSCLSELPSCIMFLQSIRYIDLSNTPITKLPDSIDNLQNLQTLKLRDCFKLYQLPSGMWKLSNLRHLDFDVLRQLRSMPPGIGKLTHLQTLSAFLIGKEEGCQIRELKNLTNLTAPFCISGLENVVDLEDVKEAALIEKNYIPSLELRWTVEEVKNSREDEEIFEHLRPSLRLQELKILNYGGSKLPTWIGDRSYECLVDLSLHSFNNCRLLASIGGLPSLRFLNMAKMNELERIDELFCRNGSEKFQHHAFPFLEKLTFEYMPKWEEWTGVQSRDFPFLRNLRLVHCPKLKSLPPLWCLTRSLETLDGVEIAVLKRLQIDDCPELRKRYHKSGGQDWPKITRVHTILIDDEGWLRPWRFD